MFFHWFVDAMKVAHSPKTCRRPIPAQEGFRSKRVASLILHEIPPGRSSLCKGKVFGKALISLELERKAVNLLFTGSWRSGRRV